MKHDDAWMLPALGSAPKEDEGDVRLRCSSVLFHPRVFAKGKLWELRELMHKSGNKIRG